MRAWAASGTPARSCENGGCGRGECGASGSRRYAAARVTTWRRSRRRLPGWQGTHGQTPGLASSLFARLVRQFLAQRRDLLVSFHRERAEEHHGCERAHVQHQRLVVLFDDKDEKGEYFVARGASVKPRCFVHASVCVPPSRAELSILSWSFVPSFRRGSTMTLYHRLSGAG